jgi:hypothetical protein
VVTDRDRSVVRWVAVIGAASAQDVMARFRLGRTVGYRRLAALVECGLLSRQRLVYGQPALYTATRDGLAWGIPQSNRRLPPAEPVGGVGAPRRRDCGSACGFQAPARRDTQGAAPGLQLLTARQ